MKEGFFKTGRMASLMENDLLFHISKSFAKSIVSGNNESYDCFCRLLDSRKLGLLLIYLEPIVAESLMNYLDGIGDERNLYILRKCHIKSRQKQQLLKDLKIRVVIGCYRNAEILRKIGTIVYVTPQYVNKANLFYPPVLLCENLVDCKLYGDKIARFYDFNISIGLTQVLLSNRRYHSGGGSTTHATYEKFKNDGLDFCICITDSDRRCPKDGVGPTAKFVANVDAKYRSPLVSHMIIDMYSAENIVPIALLEDIFCVEKMRVMRENSVYTEKSEGKIFGNTFH